MSTRNQALSANDIRDEHEILEIRLGQLDKHLSLSPEEHYEKQIIKKRKLALKDRLNQNPS